MGPLFSGWPELAAIVLKTITPVDRSFVAGSSRSNRDTVLKTKDTLPIAGVTPGSGLEVFTDSVEKLRYGAFKYPELLLDERGRRYSSKRGSVCAAAARKGKFDVLREARALGCSWDVRVGTNACANGHLKILQLACAPYQCSKVVLVPRCYRFAARGGYLEVIKFLWDERCP